MSNFAEDTNVPTNGCISRQALCEYALNQKDKSVTPNDIMRFPSAEPKKGRWVPVTNGRGGNECSACHSYAPSYKNGDEHLSAYCPNCGAKMEVIE